MDSPRLRVAFTEHERTRAIAFIEDRMRSAFSCEPPPTTGLVLYAEREGSIVGSIVLEADPVEGPFPIESHYRHPLGTIPLLHPRATIVQGTRWNAAQQGVSHLLLTGAAHIACSLGKPIMLIEAKPYSVERLRSLGMPCTEVPGIALNLEMIRADVGDGGMKYFIEPPLPTLYLMTLSRLV